MVDGADLSHHAPGSSAQTRSDSALDDLAVTIYCARYPAGQQVSLHHHHRGQLLYARVGIMLVTTNAGRWAVPPQQAVWLPPGVTHEVSMPAPVDMRSLYFRPDIAAQLSPDCRVVEVTALLRELIARLVTYPIDSTTAQTSARLNRLLAVLLDELASLGSPPLHLPTPQDPRIRRITDALIADPADQRSLDVWSASAGASSRTLARLFLKETSMGFREWRQRLRLLTALEQIATGQDVSTVALSLGYHSPSAFISMFHRELGETPGRYLIATTTR